MSLATYSFRRGETIYLALDAMTGTTGSVSAISAKLRKLEPGVKTLAQNAPDAAAFTVTVRAASGDIPAGWDLRVPAATSVGLAAGLYVADARLVISSDVEITESVTVQITEPATPA